jgi:hypothetical protein
MPRVAPPEDRDDPAGDRDGFAQSLRAWQAEQRLLNLHEYMAAYNLTWREVEAGIKHGILIAYLPPAQFIKSVRSPYPVGVYYFEPVAPTPAQRKSIQENTLLSRLDAAAYLGIEPKVFDRLRKKTGLQRAGRFSTSGGHFGNLFRLSDVMRLAE